MKFFDPDGRFILQWNKTFLLCSVIALSLDPLFFYIPIVDGTQKCIDVDRKLEIVLVILVIIRSLDGPTPYPTKRILKFIILSQYVLRVIRISLFYKKVTNMSGSLTDRAWAGAAFNFFLYVHSSHMIGALWYLLAIESELRCWDIACQRNSFSSKYLYCGEGRVGDFGFLNTSCPLLERNEIKDSTNFDFGIFLDALQTRVLETTDFPRKFLYSSWWGLQSLSSLGQGLKASTFYGEVLFAQFIAIIGLVLFALLIGNMQKYLQSYLNLTLRVEEMKEKREEIEKKRREEEDLMSRYSLPEPLKERIRGHNHMKWKITRGVELDSFVKDLPRDLGRDIKRHLCFPLLMRVPLFQAMDDHIMDVMCDRLKPVLYTENSYILHEGDPVPEMFFITRGKLLSVTTNGGRTGFFNSAYLRAGDFCGDELLTWALLAPSTPTAVPVSTRTVQSLTNVEAFALVADDVLLVATQFKHFTHSRRVQHIFRFYSQQWRTWAACYIQVAWRRHRRYRLEQALEKEEKMLEAALATGRETSALSLGATIYAARFSSNALRMLRQNHTNNADPSTSNWPVKPAQPDFEDDATNVTLS